MTLDPVTHCPVIDIHRNGAYCYTTARFHTTRAAIADCRSRSHTLVAGVPFRLEAVTPCDRITAHHR